MPDVVFLDIALGRSGAEPALDVLAAHAFPGIVQIVSGRADLDIGRIVSSGKARNLTMAEPIHKPFRIHDIEAALEEALDALTDVTSAPRICCPPDLMEWLDPSTRQGRVTELVYSNLSIRECLKELEAGVFAPPLSEQLHPEVTGSVVLAVTVADMAAIVQQMKGTIFAKFAFTEADVFRDVEQSRTVFAALKGAGATIRLDHCGTRTLAMTAHRPFEVDEIVLRAFVRAHASGVSAVRKLQTIANLVHRSGARIMAADLDPGQSSFLLARAGFDLVRFADARLPAAKPAHRSRIARNGEAWRAVSLTQLISAGRHGK